MQPDELTVAPPAAQEHVAAVQVRHAAGAGGAACQWQQWGMAAAVANDGNSGVGCSEQQLVSAAIENHSPTLSLKPLFRCILTPLLPHFLTPPLT